MTKNELIDCVKKTRECLCAFRDNLDQAIAQVDEDAVEIRKLYHVNGNDGARGAFRELDDRLKTFEYQLKEVKDLPAGTLVMCKLKEGQPDGWRLQYYTGAGVTKPTKDTRARSGDWLYVVPLEYFHPDAPDWRPEECHNWANFGKEEK